MTVTLSKFFAAERSMVGPPMSMFSINSSACQAVLCRGGLKGIEIYDDEIDRSNAVLRGLLLIFGMIAPIEQAAVDLRDAASSRGRQAFPANR